MLREIEPALPGEKIADPDQPHASSVERSEKGPAKRYKITVAAQTMSSSVLSLGALLRNRFGIGRREGHANAPPAVPTKLKSGTLRQHEGGSGRGQIDQRSCGASI